MYIIEIHGAVIRHRFLEAYLNVDVCVCVPIQPLLDCYMKLKKRGGVVLLKLTETWLREYQV